MKRNRKQDMPDRPSTADAEGRGRERSVMDDEETFEHGSGGSDVSQGMGSGERGSGGEKNQEQGKRQYPAERGRSDSER